MSDNINYNKKTGKYSFLSVKEKAWHGLGQIVEDWPTSAGAMKGAQLDFTVEKRPLFTYDFENFQGDPENELLIPELAVPNYYATVRNDTDDVLGVVGKSYHVVQNVDAFSFFDAILESGQGIRYETAGALGNGERIFITAKLPDCLQIGKDDPIEQYLFLTNSHDGSGAITAAYTPIRIVCQNTLNAALKQYSNKFTIRHTANAEQRLKEAHRLMGTTKKTAAWTEQAFYQMTKARITDPQVMQLIRLAMAPSDTILKDLKNGKEDEFTTAFKNTCNQVFEYAMTSESQQMETTKGTVFGAYNAVTGYYQNVKEFRSPESKVKSLLYGGTAEIRGQKAFDLCLDFSEDGPVALFLN